MHLPLINLIVPHSDFCGSHDFTIQIEEIEWEKVRKSNIF